MTATKSDLLADNARITDAYRRTATANDDIYRRKGELFVQLQELAEAVRDDKLTPEILASALAMCEPRVGGESRYNMITALVDSAIAFASGDEAALDQLKDQAIAVRDYSVSSRETDALVTPRTAGAPRSSKAKISQDEAVAAIQQVAQQTGEHEVSIKLFNETHETLKHSDLVAACGKWSLVQAAAGLPITKRGRKAVKKTAE